MTEARWYASVLEDGRRWAIKPRSATREARKGWAADPPLELLEGG